MPGLYPVVDVPDFIESDTDYDRTYRKSVAWDIEKGDFIKDGRNKMILCDGLEAYQLWCFKVAQTERFHCLAYDGDIGVEMEEAVSAKENDAVESLIERTITEAIMANPRTESVGDFSFVWNGDAVVCEFYVKSVGWDKFPVKVQIRR